MTDPAADRRPDGEPTLSEELATVEADTGWHCYKTDRGHCAACTPRHPQYPDGSGTTVTAPTPKLLAHEIAVTEHRWARLGLAA
jgi:hypothetical protein